MSTYDKKLEARRAQLLARAARADAKAKAAHRTADTIASIIPAGQPILVGHHSERRHRRDLEKMRSAIRTAIQAEDEAKDLRRRAEAVGRQGVSAEDPAAVQKLGTKLEQLEQQRDRAKAINAVFRAGGWPAVIEAGLVQPTEVHALARAMSFVPGGTEVPFPPFHFTNLSAEIRRVRQRAAELAAGPPTFAPIEGDGWIIEPREDIHRVVITFASKPSKEITTKLRRGGWRWSPKQGAWLRHLNTAGLHAVRAAIDFLPVSTRAAEPTKAAAVEMPTQSRAATSTETPSKKPASASKKPAPASKKPARKKGEKPSFITWFRHAKSGQLVHAREYGYRAWPVDRRASSDEAEDS